MPRKYVRRGFVKRDPAGPDLGTPEARAKRMQALGPRRIEPDGKTPWPEPDLNHAESLLGRLLWHGTLSDTYGQARRMYEMGVTLCGWWLLVYPKTNTQGTLGQFRPGGSTEVDTDAARANLDLAREACKDRSVYDAVVNVCVFGRYDYRRLEKLRTGLCRLINWQRDVAREKAA